MGTDIHTVFQAKRNGKWEDIPSKFEENRHYFLFAWLADVRNGFGFAGIPTHTAILPISPPRGLPADFQIDEDTHSLPKEVFEQTWRAGYRDSEEDTAIWMGDHSFSWLSADEILSAATPKGVLRTGVIPLAYYESWDKESQPEEWSGGISGRGIVVSQPSEISPATTHVQVEWFAPTNELSYFIDEIKRLKDLHGEVRMVFGFDS